jgi:hypothetical protein
VQDRRTSRNQLTVLRIAGSHTMAGIGEASAILAVTQLGFTFASKLTDFLGDYKEAGDLIKSLSDEVEATSSSLQNLGELAKSNGLKNPRGVSDALKLTNRCEKTITKIRTILRLENVPLDSVPTSQPTELTRLDRLRLAASKAKLEIPRAELGRLKSEMTLLYVTLMSFKAYVMWTVDLAPANIVLGQPKTTKIAIETRFPR